MASSDTTVSLAYDDSAIRAKLAQLKAKTEDLTPAMRDIGEFMLLQHDQRFDKEVDFRGNPLQPLSARTLATKRAEGKILKILQRTGLMRSRTAYTVTSDSVTITNNDRKARKHQLGIGVPKREIFGINPTEDVPEIIAIIEDYLVA